MPKRERGGEGRRHPEDCRAAPGSTPNKALRTWVRAERFPQAASGQRWEKWRPQASWTDWAAGFRVGGPRALPAPTGPVSPSRNVHNSSTASSGLPCLFPCAPAPQSPGPRLLCLETNRCHRDAAEFPAGSRTWTPPESRDPTNC